MSVDSTRAYVKDNGGGRWLFSYLPLFTTGQWWTHADTSEGSWLGVTFSRAVEQLRQDAIPETNIYSMVMFFMWMYPNSFN